MNDSIKSILLKAKNIAIIGASSNPNKDSFIVMKYLQKRGYKIFPINSKTLNTMILGEKVYKNISEIKIDIDIVNIFRPSNEILELVKIIKDKNIKTIWLQLDIFCLKSKKISIDKGINFIQDKCTMIECKKIYYSQLTLN